MATVACKIVEVCIFKFQDDRPMYLMLHRSKDERIYPDIWQFVSGSIEKGEKAVDAARRELAEETSLRPKAFWVVPYVNAFFDPAYDAVNLSPLFAAQTEEGDEPRLSQEHDRYCWVEYEEAHRTLVWPGQRAGLRIVHDYLLQGERAERLCRIL